MKKLIALGALAMSGPVFGACVVVTDGAPDSLPNADITAVEMSTVGSDLVVAIETLGGEFSSLAWFDVFMTYSNGQKWFVEADATLPASTPLIYYGTWDGQYDLSYANDGGSIGEVSIEDGKFVIRIGLSQIGSPSGEMEVFAASQEPVFGGDAYSFGFTLDITDTGAYAVGDSCGGRSEELESGIETALESDGQTFSSGAGGLGYLMLLGGLLAFRRR